MHAAKDSEPSDNFVVLSVVQNFELHTNWVFYKLIWCEIDLSAAEAESH